MGGKWNGVWEKLLSVLLTANIAVMGWLWANVARLAERMDRHCEDRAIHVALSPADLVGRREFEAARERMERIEEKVDRLTLGRMTNGD